jgi:hypothetical protein
VSDVARFVAFNIFQTSVNQKVAFLGDNKKGLPSWSPADIARARKHGYRLFADSLPDDDPFRLSMLENTENSKNLQNELNAIAKRLSDAEVRYLCDRLAVRQRIRKTGITCGQVNLGYLLEKTFVPRERVLVDHVSDRLQQFGAMRMFIYGHTHQYENEWPLRTNGPIGIKVRVLNTGAFQRVVDEETYVRIVKSKNLSEAEGLKRLGVEDLPPCYTAVTVTYQSTMPIASLYKWYMPEDGTGALLESGDPQCNQLPIVYKQ